MVVLQATAAARVVARPSTSLATSSACWWAAATMGVGLGHSRCREVAAMAAARRLERRHMATLARCRALGGWSNYRQT